MDFSIKNYAKLGELFGVPIYLDDTLISTWIVMGVLILFAVVVRIMLTRFKGVPRGFQNIVETLVETMHNFTKSTMGEAAEGFGGLFFSIFAFIILSNYSGLFTLRPPTADLKVTGALGMMTFFLIMFSGIYYQRLRYLKSLFEPSPIFFPINVIGELSRPISLAFRLFGNILGGTIIMGLVYEMLPIFLRFFLPDVLHAYFDIFAGALQAFIFTVLSMTFIQQKVAGES